MSVAKYLLLLPFCFFLLCFDADAQVVKGKLGLVIDGDSFYMVQDNGRRVRLRISGIDSPENNQPYGVEAKAFLTTLLENNDIIMTPDGADRMGRTVAKVTVDGKDIASEMIKNGYSWHYKKYSDDADLAKLETEAKAKKAGLWKDATPVAPWTFRNQESNTAKQ